jgi:hypothetical protein
MELGWKPFMGGQASDQYEDPKTGVVPKLFVNSLRLLNPEMMLG